jgi:hypothetical protein
MSQENEHRPQGQPLKHQIKEEMVAKPAKSKDHRRRQEEEGVHLHQVLEGRQGR